MHGSMRVRMNEMSLCERPSLHGSMRVWVYMCICRLPSSSRSDFQYDTECFLQCVDMIFSRNLLSRILK